jgi:hypothetical protein
LLEQIFINKIFRKKLAKNSFRQDPDPEFFKSQIRIRSTAFTFAGLLQDPAEFLEMHMAQVTNREKKIFILKKFTNLQLKLTNYVLNTSSVAELEPQRDAAPNLMLSIGGL